MTRLEREIKLITELTDNAKIQCRTEAMDFVGTLIEEWKKLGDAYMASNHPSAIYIYEAYKECAEMLEKRIEKFAGS